MTAVLPSRGVLGILGAVLAGVLSAAAFAVALPYSDTFIVMLAYLAPLPLFVCGFSAGLVSAALSALIGVVGVMLTLSPQVALMYGGLFALPTVLLVALALRYRVGSDQKVYWYPEGYLLVALALYGAAGFMLANGVAYDEEGGLMGLTLRAMNDVIKAITAQIDQLAAQGIDATMIAGYKAGVDQIQLLLPKVAFVLPTLILSSWFMLMVIVGVVSQIIAAQQSWSLRAAFSFSNIHLPTAYVIATGLAGLCYFVPVEMVSYIGANLCMPLCLPITFAGLGVVHTYAETLSRPKLFLFAFYLLLTILFWLILLVTALGVAEQGLHLRQRIMTKKSTPI